MGLFKTTTSEKIRQLEDKLSDIISEKRQMEKSIEKYGKELAEELTKIEGWKTMVKHCLPHYEKYPTQFLDWCSYHVSDGKLYVVKGYSDDQDYNFLVIDLSIPLEEQVKMALKEEEEKKKVAEKLKDSERYERDMEALINMGMETISFEEWKEKTKVK